MSGAAEPVSINLAAGLDALAALLGQGVLVLGDSGAVLHADAQALTLLGVATVSELDAAWSGLRERLGRQEAGGPASCLLAQATQKGPSLLRADLHPLPGSGCQLVLLRDAATLSCRDRTLIAAAHDNMLELLSASAAHDLSGSLNNMQFALALLEGALTHRLEEGSEDRIARHLKMLKEEQGRMLSIVRGLPERFSSPSEHECRPVDLGSLLETVGQQVRHEAAVRRVRCRYSFPPEPVRAEARRVQLMLALLLTMASLLELSEAETDIVAELARQGERAVLTFEAASLAVPPAFQKPAGFGTPSQDCAMTLQAARMIVESHGGRLEMTGMGETGTRLRVDLPALAAPSPNVEMAGIL